MLCMRKDDMEKGKRGEGGGGEGEERGKYEMRDKHDSCTYNMRVL